MGTKRSSRRLSDQRRSPADLIIDAIARAGVRYVFGIPGAAISPIFDALCDHPEVALVVPKHEMTAVYAAIGYARATRNLGVAAVTSGPGVLNAVSALASAQLDGVPVLLLVGEVARSVSGRGALQDGGSHGLDVVNLMRPLCKLAIQVPEASAIPFTVRRAMDTALSGRKGPVVVTMPVDLAMSKMGVPYISQHAFTTFELEDGVLDAATKALRRAKRSVLFVGSGCRWGRGPELIRELAERLDIPVMTTPKGKGIFPEGHRLSLGVFGLGGHPSAAEYLSGGVELVVALATRMGELSSQGWSSLLKPTRTLIHVDVESTHVGCSYPTQISVSAPAEQFVEAVLERLGDTQVSEPRTLGRKLMVDPWSLTATRDRIPAARATVELAKAVGPGARFAVDSGEHTLYAIHYLPAEAQDTVLLQLGLGAMGASLGAGLGIQSADRARPVVVLCGDGGFLMCAAEVATAAQWGLPIIFAVFNDQRLGMTELGHQSFYGRTPKFPTGPANIAAMGQCLGAESHVITRPGQMEALELSQPRSRPVLLDIRIDSSFAFSKADSKRSWIKAATG